MNFLFIGESDYANSGRLMAKALETQGHQTKTFVGRHSVLEYPDQGELFRTKSQWIIEIPQWIEWADAITVIQSELPRGMGGQYPIPMQSGEKDRWLNQMNKPIIVLHGGGYYRAHKKFYLRQWAHAKHHICYSSDLMGRFEHESLVLPPVNDEYFGFDSRNGELSLGHFPSRPEDKGTANILQVFRNSGLSWKSGPRLPWLEHIKRFKECDAVVDQIQLMVKGERVGEWVSSATEAAASGCISIANSHNPLPYKETYGKLPGLWICNTFEELAEKLNRLSKMSRAELEDTRHQCFDWCRGNHFLEPTGKILSRIYEKCVNPDHGKVTVLSGSKSIRRARMEPGAA